jgi:hypothetical protein
MSETKKNNKREVSIPIQIIIFVICLTSIPYTILNRTFDDFIRYSAYISGASLTLILGIIFFFSLKGSKQSKFEIFFSIGSVALATLFAGPIYYSIIAAFKDLYLWIQSPSVSREWAIILAVVLTIILGFSLFFFRLKFRSIYGFTEALVGLGVAVQKVSSENSLEITNSSFYLAILTASVYLFVRGLDNIHQGLTKEPFDPYGQKLYAYFNRKKSSRL